jgi:hypothetical protein
LHRPVIVRPRILARLETAQVKTAASAVRRNAAKRRGNQKEKRPRAVPPRTR